MATHVEETDRSGAVSAQRDLSLWVPSRPVLVHAGQLFLARDVQRRMLPANDGRNALRVAAAAAFDQFTELGDAVHNLFDDSWGRLGVAQLKVMAPRPGARLIGGFVDTHLYVGLRIYWRDELDFKKTAQKGLIDYYTLGQEVAVEWDALLPGTQRLPMRDFDDDQ